MEHGLAIGDTAGSEQITPGRVPDTVPLDHAVFVEPLACAIHAVDRAGIVGDTVLVAGFEPIGLGMLAAATLRRPGLLIATDLHQQRLDRARACGADLALDAGALPFAEIGTALEMTASGAESVEVTLAPATTLAHG